MSALDWPHGTVTGYRDHRCDCTHCREAHRIKVAAWRRRNAATKLPPDDSRHGTVNGYRNLYCRCDACRAASTEQSRVEYEARKIRAAAQNTPRP